MSTNNRWARRARTSAPGSPRGRRRRLTFETLSRREVLAAAPGTILISEVVASNHESLIDEDGDTPDWIEILNLNGTPIDLTGYGLSDDLDEPFKWSFDGVTIQPYSHLLVFASGKDRVNHTNFSIKASGEEVLLTAPDGTRIDEVVTSETRADVSQGRVFDEQLSFPYFDPPTPGLFNDWPWYLGFTDEPTISVESGHYDTPFTATIAAADPNDYVFYTVDGSVPDFTDTLYSGESIPIDDTTILRATAYRDFYLPSRTETETFLFGVDSDLPVVNLSVNFEDMFDPVTGMYMPGPNPGDPPWFPDANFRQDIEIPAHVTYFEIDGDVEISQDVGLEIHGGISRAFPKKALKLKARSRFGDDDLSHQFFAEKSVDDFSTLLLRASSGDQFNTTFRDALVQSLTDITSLDYQPYQPTVVLINGLYWGIHNLRESAVTDYVADNYGYDEDEIDFLENSSGSWQIRAGTTDNYTDLWTFLVTSDLNDPQKYEELKQIIDVDMFIDYFAAEVYTGNDDWPGNNYRIWRPTEEGGLWQPILFDLDSGFFEGNLFDATLLNAFNDQPTSDPNAKNKPEDTLFWRLLFSSQEFTNEFIRRMGDFTNIVYEPTRVIERIDQFEAAIASEIPNEINQWGLIQSVGAWQTEVDKLRTFAELRPFVMDLHMQYVFGLSGKSPITLVNVAPSDGNLQINSQIVPDDVWTGQYYREVPVNVTAIPEPGFEFTGWAGNTEAIVGGSAADSEISVDMTSDVVLWAQFQPIAVPEPTIVFSEINYNSADNFDVGDWIELHNYGNDAIDLANFVFRDGGNIEDDEPGFTLPAYVLQPGEYVVLVESAASFATFFPGVSNVVEGWDYGLGGGGDTLALYDPIGDIVDLLEYDDKSPWPEEPDGDGATLELIDPLLDNTLPSSWAASQGNGTPGQGYTP